MAVQDVIPIEALFDERLGLNRSWDPLPALRGALAIIGVDVMSGHRFVVFGRKILRRIARTGRPARVPVLWIGLDQDTDELEKLLALVTVVKGRHDYLPG
jgi:hypothetical protein